MKAILFFLFIIQVAVAQTVVSTKMGNVNFTSNAPLESIKAATNSLSAAFKLQERVFAFSIPINSFQGFNSSLQKEHFNDNYMESSKFPHGTFKGKIIEEVDLTKNGTYPVRAKGSLMIHGVAKERIIKANVTVNNGVLTITSAFEVPLVDHNVAVPKLVFQKIAEIIKINIKATLQKAG